MNNPNPHKNLRKKRVSHALSAIRRQWAVVTLVLIGLSSSAIAQQAQPPAAHRAATAAASGEWQRFREGLRKAKPMPDPRQALRSNVPTPRGDLVTFDLKTRTPRVVASGTTAAATGSGSDHGFTGQLPVPRNGAPANVISEAPREGESALTSATGVQPFSTTPTPPRPLYYPYSSPFKTEFRLLMRFEIAGFPDQYFLCSASAAASHHLLSAAHCIYNHDPLGDGSGRGANFAAELWAWPAETDVVDPIDHSNWPDYPYGVAKMISATTYNQWIDSSDLNWDFSFIDVDRRIGDHIGWMGTEWGVTTTALNFDGYPAEAPYVPSDNPFQYPGFDANNVIAYTCCRIELDAYTYGGHSGGGVWRYDGTNEYIEGVNSTSNRTGYAEATLFTKQTNSDLTVAIDDNIVPNDLAQLIEYVFNGSSKGLLGTSIALGDSFGVTLNAFNAGYASAGDTTADVYLTTSSVDVTSGYYIGTVDLGVLDAYTYTVQNPYLTVPAYIPTGNYYVGWVLNGENQQYDTDNNTAIITTQSLQVVGLSSFSATPSTLIGGSTATGAVYLTGPVQAGGAYILLSSNSGAVSVPSYVYVSGGSTSAVFSMQTLPVAAKTTAFLTASGAGATLTTALTVQAPTPISLRLSPLTVSAGNRSTGTVRLSGPAPAAGAKLLLSSNSTVAKVPASVVVAAGATGATFSVSTSAIGANTSPKIAASYAGSIVTASLMVNAVELSSIAVSPTSIVGGSADLGTVTLTAAAPSTGIVVPLNSSISEVKVPVSVTVPGGKTSTTFAITSSPVTASMLATITATYGTGPKTTTLTVEPVQPTAGLSVHP